MSYVHQPEIFDALHKKLRSIGPGLCGTSEKPQKAKFAERELNEVRAEGRAGRAGNWSDRGNRTGGYSSPTNSSTDTPYALAIFVTVGM